MFVPPLMTLLQGTPAPTPFYAGAKLTDSDWIYLAGPAAIYLSSPNKTFATWQMIGTAGQKGAQVAAYDHTAKTWSERYKVGNFLLTDDAHGYTSIAQDSSGFFYTFFGTHASVLPWSISTAANDITAWTQQTAIPGSISYPEAVFVGTKMYLFYRDDSSAGATKRTLALRIATPSGGNATFAAQNIIVDLGADSRFEPNTPKVVGTDIHITCVRADNADAARKGVYYFVYDTVTGAVKNHDASFSTAAGSLPVGLTSANANYRLYDHGTGQGDVPVMAFDSSGDPHIVYADNGGSGVAYVLRHFKRTSGTWGAPVTVGSLAVFGTGVGGFVTIYSLVAGASGSMEAWYVNVAGDKLRRIRGSDGVWGAEQTILKAGSLQLLGTQPVMNGKSDMRTIFCEVTSSELDSSAVVCKRYAYGDAGPVTATIPMAVVDSSYANVVLLLGCESRDAVTTLIDESDQCFIPTFQGNAQIDTAKSKFGNASLLLDGTGDYVTFQDDTQFKVTNGNFTVESWVWVNVGSRVQTLFAKRPAVSASEYSFYIDASNHLQMTAFASGAAVLNVTGTTAVTTGAWHHIAFSRSGTTWRGFLDGALEVSGTESGTPTNNTQLFHIGRDPSNTARDFNGWLDEIRFTAGVARYTATFTAPVAAFPRR